MLVHYSAFGPASTNFVLVGCEKTRKAAIFDAPPGSGSYLVKRLEELKLEPEMLLLTHTHWDHTADANYLKEKLGIPLYVHPLDAPNLEKPGTDGLPLFF